MLICLGAVGFAFGAYGCSFYIYKKKARPRGQPFGTDIHTHTYEMVKMGEREVKRNLSQPKPTQPAETIAL